ncbi:peptidase dimerization domain-containing protein [Pilimelia columellifera]|uniref:Peptidase M20 dimerisation domain-containing protein n=1 Tax=Pilimelia columellifera subsp. columellifera TaxID=706583 RepID=A0ABN3NRH4_9ACTN
MVGAAASLDLPEERLRAEAGVVEGVRLIGSEPLADRLWSKPSIAVLGIDCPPTEGAPNALTPYARAKLNLRLAPGQEPAAAFEALRKHLEANAPWGTRPVVTLEQTGARASLTPRVRASLHLVEFARVCLAEALLLANLPAALANSRDNL